MHPRWVAIASYFISVLLYLVATYAGDIRMDTLQPNGLAEIQYPYSVFSFFAALAALGALLFGITLSLVVLRGRTANSGRTLVGSGLLSAGALAVLFAVFWYTVNLQDAGPRGLGGCAPSLQQYLQGVMTVSTVIAVTGLLAAGLGARLLMKGRMRAEG